MISTAKLILILASFADMVSGSDDTQRSGHNAGAMFFHPHIPTQGRLHCTQHTILCTALQVLTKSVRERNPQQVFAVVAQKNGLLGERVVCAMPLARARDP